MKRVFKLGITSRCQDGKHVLFFDYDLKDWELIRRELLRLQKYLFLSDIYIVETKSGFHAFCLDKFCLNMAYAIYRYCNLACNTHREIGKERGKWTFAVDENKVAFCILESRYSFREKSNAHRLFLNACYGFNIEKDGLFDDFSTLEFEVFDKLEGDDE